MSATDFFDEMFYMPSRKTDGIIFTEQISSKEQFSTKCDAKFLPEDSANKEFSRSIGNWCKIISSSLNNTNTKQAWKSGTEKVSQTLNKLGNTFGVISQRIKKSTKKRQSLINTNSPRSPITPYTRSRAVLGRTPTKLYSPFNIDTPAGKENKSNRFVKDENHLISSSTTARKKNLWRTRLNLNVTDGENCENTEETILSKDLLETQIEIDEFQFFAKRIAQSSFNN